MTDENHEDSNNDSDEQQQEAVPEGEQDAPPKFVDSDAENAEEHIIGDEQEEAHAPEIVPIPPTTAQFEQLYQQLADELAKNESLTHKNNELVSTNKALKAELTPLKIKMAMMTTAQEDNTAIYNAQLVEIATLQTDLRAAQADLEQAKADYLKTCFDKDQIKLDYEDLMHEHQHFNDTLSGQEQRHLAQRAALDERSAVQNAEIASLRANLNEYTDVTARLTGIKRDTAEGISPLGESQTHTFAIDAHDQSADEIYKIKLESLMHRVKVPSADIKKARKQPIELPPGFTLLGDTPEGMKPGKAPTFVETYVQYCTQVQNTCSALALPHVLRSLDATLPDGKKIYPFVSSDEDALVALEVVEAMWKDPDAHEQLLEDYRVLLDVLSKFISHATHASLFVSLNNTMEVDGWKSACEMLVQEIVSMYSPASPSLASSALQGITSPALAPLCVPGEMRVRAHKLKMFLTMYSAMYTHKPFAHDLKPSAVYAQILQAFAKPASLHWWHSVVLQTRDPMHALTLNDLYLELTKFSQLEDKFNSPAIMNSLTVATVPRAHRAIPVAVATAQPPPNKRPTHDAPAPPRADGGCGAQYAGRNDYPRENRENRRGRGGGTHAHNPKYPTNARNPRDVEKKNDALPTRGAVHEAKSLKWPCAFCHLQHPYKECTHEEAMRAFMQRIASGDPMFGFTRNAIDSIQKHLEQRYGRIQVHPPAYGAAAGAMIVLPNAAAAVLPPMVNMPQAPVVAPTQPYVPTRWADRCDESPFI